MIVTVTTGERVTGQFGSFQGICGVRPVGAYQEVGFFARADDIEALTTGTLNGQIVEVLVARSRPLSADEPNFARHDRLRAVVLTVSAATGQPATFVRGRAMAINSGAYNVTGQPAGLLVRRSLSAAVAPFSMTGRAATLSKAIPDPVGFAMNGSTNPTLRTMMAGAAAGTRRGRIVWPGDSTTVGQGAGTNADSKGITASRPNRVPAVLATELTAAGYTARDCGFTVDNGMALFNQPSLPAYDPRVVYGSGAWRAQPLNTFAGGGYLQPVADGASSFSFTPDFPCDTFEVVCFNSNNYTIGLAIDGAAPATGPASFGVTSTGSGFSVVTVKAASVGTHTLTVSATITGANLRGVRAFNSVQRAVDIIVPAILGGTAAQQASTGSGWQSRDALAYDAPDLTIINLGLNDAAANISSSAYSASLQQLITTAKLSGDVLLVSPHPASTGFASVAAQTGLRDAAKQLAITNSVAYMDFYSYFGSFTPELQARMFDGLVHGKADLYAEEAQVLRRCIQAMIR